MKFNKETIKAVLAFIVIRYRKGLFLNVMLLYQDGINNTNPKYHLVYYYY